VLDSVGELSPELQLRLVELLSEEASSPAGELKESAGCRIVATSREDLGVLVEEGRFRADLYRALAMVSLCLPPLKKRRGDIAVLAEHFRDLFACRHVKTNRGFSAESLLYLKDHPWPGNVAELRDAVERAVLVCRDSRIMPSHLALTPVSSSASQGSHGSNGVAADARRSRPRPSPDGEILPLKEALEEPERQLILAALEALNWNRQETARVLDINRTTLYKKMKKYGLIFDEPVWVN
jgi:two-component system response regulator HydG